MKSTNSKYIISIIVAFLTICLVVTFYYFNGNKNIKSEIEFNNIQQWGLLNTGQKVRGEKGIEQLDINALEAWEITKGESDVLVGIIDTGIDISDPVIKDNIYMNSVETINGEDDDNNGYIDDVNGWNFIDNSNQVYEGLTSDYHGTFIASLIAGKHVETNEVWGVAPGVTIVPLKTISGSSGSIDAAIEAIEYGHNLGVRIFNISWDTTEYDEDLFRAIEKYNDTIFITSSGKGKYNMEINPVFPCKYNLDNIVCVSAVDNKGELEFYSGYGSGTVPAPGVNILGVLPEGLTDFSNGSSFATAYVTGIVALAKSISSDYNASQLVEIINKSKTTINRNGTKIEIIDAKQVLEEVSSPQ